MGVLVQVFFFYIEDHIFLKMLPYVMHSIQELSIVNDLSNWGNLNVQFIGKLIECNEAFVCGCIEKNSLSTIGVDFSLSACIPPRNSVVRIWGELELQDGPDQKIPLVKAKVSRVITSIDIPLYKKSLTIRRKFTSNFTTVKRNSLFGIL